MSGSTMNTAKQAEAAGVSSQNAVVANDEPVYTGSTPTVVPDLVSADVLSVTQNVVVANEPNAPVSGEGE